MNINENVLIIIPTHSKYIEVVQNFLQLLSKNWPNCPYRIIISMCGKSIKIDDYECIYNGVNASLIDCILSVHKRYKYDYYICFLGDAFINKKIMNESISNIINLLYTYRINYCSLINERSYVQPKLVDNTYLRYIHSKDRYSHSFISFVASNYYVEQCLSQYKSDLDFELSYLSVKKNFYYNDHAIVTYNVLNIVTGITKGKWNRFSLWELKKANPEVDFANMPLESYFESLYSLLHGWLISYIPDSVRKTLKAFGYIKKRSVSKD